MSDPKIRKIIIIPARFGSSRFPGKPLALVKGKTILQRTWEIAKSLEPECEAWISTDSDAIEKAATAWGAKVLRTNAQYRNGTERVCASWRLLGSPEALVLNLQGDAPLTPPWVLQDLLEALASRPKIELLTPYLLLDSQKECASFLKGAALGRGTTVVTNFQDEALYFSKARLPFFRRNQKTLQAVSYKRHLGIYVYTSQALCKWAEDLEPCALEEIEGLEQLRPLYHGQRIQCMRVDYQGRSHASCDTPEDLQVLEKMIETQGELF